MKQIYLECNSGISGDMTVAALLDLGADELVLRGALENLLPGEFAIDIHRVIKNGISACKFDVILNEEHQQIDAHHHSHHVTHRNLAMIDDIIERADITPYARRLAHRMFRIVAKAEAEVHGLDINEVHFHEVGAADSIADIIATAVCIDNLGINDVIVSPLSEGSGQVQCQHGWLWVPVPAVTNIVIDNKLTMKLTDNEGEMITPTGAAIAAALRTDSHLPDTFIIERTGIGAGTKDFEKPNILRAMIIESIVSEKSSEESGIWVLESNIDDTTGESLGYTMDKLFEHGALDVWYQPVYMKKNRPAYLLGLMCHSDEISELENIIFTNTTTIGIRRHFCERTVLSRKKCVRNTKYGPVKVKICNLNDAERIYPEHESVRKLADKTGIGYNQIYQDIIESCRENERK